MGHGPGEFGLVTDMVEDKAGNYYVSEYGEYDRVQKFDHDGKFILQWGTHGEDPGQFSRPQGLAIDEFDHIWVADACNHRIQVFDTAGNLLSLWGQCGPALGQLSYPYNLTLDGEGHVYIVRVRQSPRPKIYARWQIARRLGNSWCRRRAIVQPMGAGSR